MFLLIDGKNRRTAAFHVLGRGATDLPSRTRLSMENRLVSSLINIGMPRTTGNVFAHFSSLHRRVAPLSSSLPPQQGQVSSCTMALSSSTQPSSDGACLTEPRTALDRKSTRLNSSHSQIS